MAIADPIKKQVAYKKESAWNTAPGASSAQVLARTTGGGKVSRDAIQSNEMRPDQQRGLFRLGMKKTSYSLSGLLTPGVWKDFIASTLRKAFAADTPSTSLSITVAGSGPTYTITRGSGSWITDGVNLFDVGRLTAGSFNAANLNKNLIVVGVTATILTVLVMNGVALAAEGPIASATWTPTGKKTYMPATGHTDESYAIEDWYSDASLSELYTGLKVTGLEISAPPNADATIKLDFAGGDLTTAASAYYTSPTAASSNKQAGSLLGVILSAAAPAAGLGIVTSASVKVATGAAAADGVIGSLVTPGVGIGALSAGGSFSAYFESATLRDAFLAETEHMFALYLVSSGDAAADFISLVMPSIKYTGADKDDSENKKVVQTFPFEASNNVGGGTTNYADLTTLMIQDSQA